MPLPLRLALRELGGGLMGLRLLAVCVFLGVAALGGVGSLSSAILQGLGAKGQEILGGDIEIELPLRAATSAERAAFARAGRVSEVVRARAMVGRGETRVLGELKAVDARWPLYGSATLVGGARIAPALAGGGAALAPALADRLGVRVGDRIEVGATSLTVRGLIAEEPDRAGGGIAFGPAIVIGLDALPATQLLQPGSLASHLYRIALPPGADPKASIAALRAATGGKGWEVRDRSNGAPGLRRFVEQLGQFLTLVGLSALVVAGVGVGQGVTGYLASKRGTIATLKGLGASSATIRASYLIQIAVVTVGAVLLGLIAGGAAPWAFAHLAADALPVAPAAGVQPRPLLLAAAYGVLVALAFALSPLASAARTSPARLLRADLDAVTRPGAGTLIAIAVIGAALLALAIGGSGNPVFAAAFVGGVGMLVAVLGGLALLLRHLAARAPRPRSPIARLALANLHRPGAPLTQLVIALGLGLSLFATLAVIETSLAARIAGALPAGAPDLVFIDLPKESIAPFEAMVAHTVPGAKVNAVPSLRGPVAAVNGVPVAKIVPPEGAWVLRGDRGLTYADAPPEGNRVVEGAWWPRGYAGPPLVSMDVTQAKLLGLKLGDRITVSVLGVDLEARIANFRRLDFQRPALQYMFVYDPAALRDAPHTWVATIALPTPATDTRALRRAAARGFATASIVDLHEALGQVNDLLGQILFAVRAAASVTIAAGVAVLVGALAAGRRARTYDAVILKMLGATRGQVLRAAGLEYGALALVVGVLALALGLAAGWGVLAFVLSLPFAPAPGPVLATVVLGAAVTVGLGLAGSWSALGVAPNRVLRTL